MFLTLRKSSVQLANTRNITVIMSNLLASSTPDADLPDAISEFLHVLHQRSGPKPKKEWCSLCLKFKNSFHFIVYTVGGAAGPSEEASSSGATPGSKRKGAAGPEKVAKKVRFAEKTSMTNTKEKIIGQLQRRSSQAKEN